MIANSAIALLAHPVSLSAGALATTLLVRDKRAFATRFLVALPLGVLSSKAVKRTFPRQKPRLLSLTPRQSMPSGHMAGITAFAGAFVDALSRQGALRAAPLAAAAITGVGVSRLRAREHRFSEVLVGYGIGLTAAIVAGVVARLSGQRAR